MKTLLTKNAKIINKELNFLLSNLDAPPSLKKAMVHGVLNGGKRLRPLLLIEVAKLFKPTTKKIISVACALELVHCYSLVHDDLPAMDDDDLRRGKPTVHKLFGEAQAILAGDALLTLAFEVLAKQKLNADIKIKLIENLAIAAGGQGMVGGQSLDMCLDINSKNLNEAKIKQMQEMKTGKLIIFACKAGGIVGGANKKQIKALESFGKAAGLAYQLADDILDITANEKLLGKKTKKDKAKNKINLLSIYNIDESSIDKAKKILTKQNKQAKKHLEIFGKKAKTLCEIIDFITERNY